jgi:hypothetical protein
VAAKAPQPCVANLVFESAVGSETLILRVSYDHEQIATKYYEIPEDLDHTESLSLVEAKGEGWHEQDADVAN